MAKRLVISGVSGAVTGYLILHPLSMFIHRYYDNGHAINWIFLKSAFSPDHVGMALYFTVLGCILGLIVGSYIIKIRKQYNNIKVLSLTDELTTLYNRRYFFVRLNDEIERAKRYDKKFSLLMIDIDNFKYFNDTFGHQKGDELLRKFASRVRNSVRLADFVSRYGGEEFTIIMPETDCEMAVKFAERLRHHIESVAFLNNNQEDYRRFSISIGIAEFNSSVRDCDDLIKKADTALYAAKQKGKNRVCAYESSSMEEVLSKC